MPERVLAESLSGEEVVLAITDKIAQRLRRDCFLSPNLAYEKFWCKVKIEIRATDVGRVAEVKVDETVANVPNPDDSCLDAAEAEFEIQEDAPNSVRVETGQPVPVLTKNPDGKPAVKKIHYARPKLDKAAK